MRNNRKKFPRNKDYQELKVTVSRGQEVGVERAATGKHFI